MVNNVWGDWGDKGCHTMMEDEHTLKKIVCDKYPNLPYFLFGHSMGSFITRDFIAKYGNELNGATICGTTGIFRGAKEVKEKLKEIIDAGHGEESDPNIVGSLMAGCANVVVKFKLEMNGFAMIHMYKRTMHKIHSMPSQDLLAIVLFMILSK